MIHAILHYLFWLSFKWFDFMFSEVLFTCILFLILLPVVRLLQNKSPYWQYSLWALLFIRLILPPGFGMSTSVWGSIEINYFSWHKDISFAEETAWFLEVDSKNITAQITNHKEYQNNVSWSIIPFRDRLIMVSFLVWFIGFVISLSIYIRKKKYFKNIIDDADKIETSRVCSIVKLWRKKYRISRSVRVYTSDDYLSPFTISTFKPKIYIPSAILDAGNINTVRSIIAHEMAHIKRFDDFWIQLQNIIQLFFFFYPIVWYANRQLNQTREHICDNLVLSHQEISPQNYAASIIQTLNLNMAGSLNLIWAPALQTTKQVVESRLRFILENKKMRKRHLILVLLVISLLGITTLPMASILTDSNNLNSNESVSTISVETEIGFKQPIKIGKISSNFGNRKHPIKKVVMHHNGIDIAAPKGTKVYATAPGLVEFAEMSGDWGNKIVIAHKNQFTSIYGQLSKIKVKNGENVQSGQLIGLVGSTGASTAPHLHFEIRKNNEPKDPKNYIDFSF